MQVELCKTGAWDKGKQNSVYKKLGILLIYDSTSFPREIQTYESDI